MEENITLDERKAINHLISCLNKYDSQSREYSLAQRAFRFFCKKIRSKEKTDAENVGISNGGFNTIRGV